MIFTSRLSVSIRLISFEIYFFKLLEYGSI